jgi:hypothetical protein
MKPARVIRGRLMSIRVEALHYAVAANVKTRRRKLRPGVFLQCVVDGSLCLFRPDGTDAFDGWRPRTSCDHVILRGIEYVHIDDERPWIHRYTPGVTLSFGPPVIVRGAIVKTFNTRSSTRNTTARRNGEPSRRKPRRNINLRNSRGGTRTRDPGIMSAVL